MSDTLKRIIELQDAENEKQQRQTPDQNARDAVATLREMPGQAYLFSEPVPLNAEWPAG
jgi:hypothetical protein